MAVVMICFPFRRPYSTAPRIAQLSPSVPQEVNTSSFGWQPSERESSRRAASSSFLASRPRACVELGLP